MKLESKFNTGDIVQHTFDRADQKSQTVFAVMENTLNPPKEKK